MEELAWGRVTVPKYADIRCLRVAFEVSQAWPLAAGVTGRGGGLQQQCATASTDLSNPPPTPTPHSTAKMLPQGHRNKSSHCGVICWVASSFW